LITSSGPDEPGAGDEDPAAMREALETHLSARGAPAEIRTAALDTYDIIPADIVPSAKVRAALAALTGTFAAPAIANLLTTENCTGQPASLITFQPPPEAPDLIARVTFDEAGRRVVSLNPITAGDPIERLMAILAHEAIHCDGESGLFEEVAATAFDSFLHLQLATLLPGVVVGETPLSRDLNVDAIALINSGRRLPESIGVLASDGTELVLPDTTSPYASFADLVAAAYAGLPSLSSSEPLAQVYATILAEQAGFKPGDPFDLTYLDELLGRVIPEQAVIAAIDVFELVVSPP
jgi:hypothetical protein